MCYLEMRRELIKLKMKKYFVQVLHPKSLNAIVWITECTSYAAYRFVTLAFFFSIF